jgi:hypothetical protein
MAVISNVKFNEGEERIQSLHSMCLVLSGIEAPWERVLFFGWMEVMVSQIGIAASRFPARDTRNSTGRKSDEDRRQLYV